MIDLALAIAKLDPSAEYLLSHSVADGRQVILAWRGPGTQPTPAELDIAWRLCLEEQAIDDAIEQERTAAIGRMRADASLLDVVKVLRL